MGNPWKQKPNVRNFWVKKRTVKKLPGKRSSVNRSHESVYLIASGYEWHCPDCGDLNKLYEARQNVFCSTCGHSFETGEVEHAYE